MSQIHRDDHQRQSPLNRARELAVLRLAGTVALAAAVIAVTILTSKGGPPRTNRS